MSNTIVTEAELGELRTRAQDLAERKDWSGVLSLAPTLRRDERYWIEIWAPLVALAARKVGNSSARDYLDEAVAGGFFQPELLEGELEREFGTDPDWPAVVAAMTANIPPPALELLDWPELSPALPVRLEEIAPDRRDALRERLPAPESSAWTTATQLVRWVSTRWDHSATLHAESSDALQVLDRVAGGERFACKEYALVLSQSLNACGIPARSVTLLWPNYHAGVGGGHAVSEAWIDDLSQWVVLDGQNGMYWVAEDGGTLGLVELRRRQRAGEPPAAVVSLAGKASAESTHLWWPFFDTVHPTGVVISPAPFAPLLEGIYVQESEHLRRDPAGAHPDLLELGTGTTDVEGRVAVVPVTRHPHARGFEISLGEARWRLGPVGHAWTIPTDVVGEHEAMLATVTDFGTHRPHPLRFVARNQS
jgi:hypothetical protein